MAITKEINIVVKETGMDQVNKSIQNLENAVQDTEQATKSFKTQIREANQELLKMSQKFGETSKEAVEVVAGIVCVFVVSTLDCHPVAPYNSLKLSFTLSKEFLKVSPVPSFAVVPINIVCLAIVCCY